MDNIKRYETRLVAKRFNQQEVNNYHNTFSPILKKIPFG